MPSQIEIKECWFACADIDAFESELSNNPIFVFTRTGSKLITEIIAQGTSDMGAVILLSNGYSNE